MAVRSLRAAHWNEAKHPRDNRGRFAHKGGSNWVAKVAKELGARFGDISMGAHPDHQPRGRLETGKGGLIDVGAARRRSQATIAPHPLGPAEAPGGRMGRTAAGRVTGTFEHGPKSATSSHPANAVAHLTPGDYARVQGVDQYGKPTTLNGHVQGVGKVRMGRRGSRTKQDMLAVQMAETPSGANGWRGTVYVKPDATAERTTPKPETTATGAVVGRGPAGRVETSLDTQRVGRQAGGVTIAKSKATATDGAGITDPVDLARIRSALAEHGGGYHGGPLGLSKGDAVRYTTEGHLKDLTAKYGHATVQDAVAAEIARNPGLLDLKPRSPEHKAMLAERQAASQAASKQALAAVKAGNYDEAQRIISEAELADPDYREGGFSWGDMRKYVDEQAPKLTAPSRTNTGPAADNAHGGNVETVPAGREFTMRELKSILAGEQGYAPAIRSTDEHRRLLEAAGATPAQSEAILKKLGANTEQGHLTADLTMALHFGARTEAEQEANATRMAKLLEATPRAYAGLLGDGPGAITHPKSRQVIEAMQANGWVIKDVRAGGISTWGPPGDDFKSITMISGKDRPSFYNHNQKLSGVKAIEHVGGPAPAKPSSKYGKLSDERVRQGLEMRGSSDAELVTEVKRRGIPINEPVSSSAEIAGPPGPSDALARETAPRVGRTPGGRVGGVRQTQSVSDAAETLQSVDTREAAHAALEGMTVDELKQVARRLNRTTAGLTRKDQIRNRLVETTVGSRINSDVLRRNGMGPRPGGRSEGVGEPGSGFAEPPAAPAAGSKVDQLFRERSQSGKARAFGELSAAEIIEAFQRDPGKALDAYMEKNFGKGSGRETALPPAVGNIAANLKSGDITPQQAADQMDQWAKLHRGMQYHPRMALAVQLLDGSAAKRFEQRNGRVGRTVAGPVTTPHQFDYSGLTGPQIAGLRGLEHDPQRHAEVAAGFRERNVAEAARNARATAELADIAAVGLPQHGQTPTEQRAALRALAAKAHGMDADNLMNEHVMDVPGRGQLYSASISPRNGRYGARLVNYDSHRGFTTGNGVPLSDNEVPYYIAAHNEHPDWPPDALYNDAQKRMRDAGVVAGPKREAPPDTRPEREQLRERLANLQQLRTRLSGDYRRRTETDQKIRETQDRIDAIDKAAEKAANTAPAGPASDRYKTGDYLGPGEAYVNRADVVGHTVTFDAPVPGNRAGKRQAVTGKVVRIESINGGTSQRIVIEGRSRPLVLDSGLNIIEPKRKLRAGQGRNSERHVGVPEHPTPPTRTNTDAEAHARATERARDELAAVDTPGKGEAGGTGTRATNLDKARAAGREKRAADLEASTDPGDNWAKVRALESGTLSSADLYRKKHAGPSGQRSDVMVARVRHTPDNSSGEYRITDRDGNLAGWASRTVHNGESVYVLHSENYDGEQRLEGWSDSLATGADVLINGEYSATRGGSNFGASVTQGGFKRYEGRNKSIDELDREALSREIQRVRDRLANPDLTPGLRRRAEGELARLEAERSGAIPGKGEAGGRPGAVARVDTARVTRDTGGMTATPPYAVGQHVEVLTHNFAKPDMPREWKHGVVSDVSLQDNGRHDVMVTTDDGIRHPHIVGVRGGNKNLRAAAEPTQVEPTTPAAGPVPKVTGYAKGRELEPGMLVNAADLLPMHESQGNTTGENPNPRGHADWVRVGMVGNTNDPAYKSYNSNRSLTGGMYVVFDQAGHPVGRMSANTIAEINTEQNRPEAKLDMLRMPIKVQVKVNDGFGKYHMEERDGYAPVLVPSAFAQREAGMPAPQLLREGILDPNDPNYGKRATRPAPANRPHGERVQGNRTREQYKADRAKRDQAYAASEPQRAARRAELEAQRKAEKAAEREQKKAEAERKYAAQQEQYRRDQITRQRERVLEDLADPNPQVYDRKLGTTRPATADEMAIDHLVRGSDVTRYAQAYGIKTRGRSQDEMAADIVAAVKAGKQPDLEVGAPKVLDAVAQAEADAKKIATMDKRRRTAITKAIAELKTELRTNDEFPMALEFASDALLRQIAEAFGLEGLTGKALRDTIKQLVREGREPDLDLAPVTSLKKKR